MKHICLFFSFLILPFFVNGQGPNNDAVVSASRMNILYRGVANPIEIAIPGVTSDKVTATATNGTINRTSSGWDVSPGEQAESVITVLVSNKKVSEKIFRVKNIPEPVAVFAGKNNGGISKDNASKAEALGVELRDFSWDLKFVITEFTFLISKDNKDMEIKSKGNKLTDEMKSYLADFKRGQFIVFKDIKALGPDGRVKNLNPVMLKIE
jgi:gliding motility-associated protein GldM